MAGRRVLLRAAALGLAAATAGSLHAVSNWTPPWPLAPFTPSVKRVLMDSTQGLQAALHGAHRLSGAHHRDVRARAELDLAAADADCAEGGDPAAAADLRLLLALLAARDGRTDEALRLYAEAARDSPFDRRPRALAYHLSLPPGGWTSELIRELAVAAALGGVCNVTYPDERWLLIPAACGAVDKGLVAGLQDKTLPAAERLQLLALRAYLKAKVWLLVRKAERDSAGSGAEAAPVS
ncbi:unnamed protein product [Urochloa decumbens]|uniref:Uncharacterized protein n=1 Tax=Urochloa decumbens TaxID=240449 RepID=A0ABC8ZKI6_9POAL